MGLPEYEVTWCEEVAGEVVIRARFTGSAVCPRCGQTKLRLKDKRLRRPRQES